MTRTRSDFAWQLISIVVVDILNPLLLISLALFVSVGYILTLIMPVNIDIWAALLWASVLLPLIPLSLRARQRWRLKPSHHESQPWRRLVPALPLLILLPSVVAILGSPTLNTIAHADLYFVFVNQLYHGIAPPEHILLPGFPANHYWLFHAYIAALVRATSSDTYSSLNVLNIIYIFSSLLWLAKTLVALGLGKPRTIYLGVLVLFVFGSVNLTGIVSVLSYVVQGTHESGGLDKMLLPGADRRLHSVYPKVFHASGMTPGVMAFTAALYCCVCTLKTKPKLFTLILVSSCGMASLGAMPVIVVYIVFALLGGAALTALIAHLTANGRSMPAASEVASTIIAIGPAKLVFWFVTSLALSLPLVQYVRDLTYNFQAEMRFAPFNEVNIKMTLAALPLLLPFFILLLLYNVRRRRYDYYFLWISAAVGLIIALGIQLPDFNQYKLYYLLAMLMGFAALLVLREMNRRGDRVLPTLARALLTALLALSFCNLLYAQYHIVDRAVWQYDRVGYHGVSVEANDVNDFGARIPAYYWIRDNSPNNAVVLVSPKYGRHASLFHERLNYVRKEKILSLPRTCRSICPALEELKDFYHSATSTDEYQTILDSMQQQLPGRALYAVVRDDELDAETMAQRGAQRVFQHPEPALMCIG